MLRVTLATRLALIVIVALSAISIIIIAVFYRTSVRESGLARPSPGRLAAIAEMVERSDPGARSLLLEAVASPQFSVRVEAAGAMPVPPPRLQRNQQARLDEIYSAALPGREVTVVPTTAATHDRWFPRLARAMSNAVEFRIGLNTGETLVVDATTRLPMTPFGLPVGLGAGLFGTIVALLALLVMQRETRPLAQLAAAVDRVDLSADPPPLPEARRSAPEIRAVIAAFNRLQTRLSEMMRSRMTLIGGIAHDVRTFATRLRLRVEKIADAAEQQRAIADIDDMIRLLDDALLSSKSAPGNSRRRWWTSRRWCAGRPMTVVLREVTSNWRQTRPRAMSSCSAIGWHCGASSPTSSTTPSNTVASPACGFNWKIPPSS